MRKAGMQNGGGSRDERQIEIEFRRSRENVHLLGGCLVVDAFIYRIALQALVARRAPIASQLQPLTLEPAISIREIKEPKKMGFVRSKRPTVGVIDRITLTSAQTRVIR